MQISAAMNVRKVKKPEETWKRWRTLEICSSTMMIPMAMAQTRKSFPARRLVGGWGGVCSGITGLCIFALYGEFAPRFAGRGLMIAARPPHPPLRGPSPRQRGEGHWAGSREGHSAYSPEKGTRHT